jgi:hypothetical protein
MLSVSSLYSIVDKMVNKYETIGGIKIDRDKLKYSENSCLTATLPTTIPTGPALGSKPDLRQGNPATTARNIAWPDNW